MKTNLPPKFANAVLHGDGRLHEFTLKVAGRRFFCDCGCNVFHKPDRSQTELYECNACGVRFISPSTRTPLSCWPHNPGEPADPITWLRESGETAESNGFTSNAKRFAYSADLIEQLQQKLAACDRERLHLVAKMTDERQLIKELASLARRQHYYCEDRWYSCPKEADGCANEAAGEECNCGADEHNAEVDALMQQLIKSLTD